MTAWIDVDGTAVDARNVTWVNFAPCGCVAGLAVAQSTHRADAEARVTPDQVDSDIAKVVRDHDRALGFCWTAMHREDAKDLGWANCPHTPAWGVAPDPTLEGWTWATTDLTFMPSQARRTHRRHLVTTDRVEKEHLDDQAARDAARKVRFARSGATVTFCGKRKTGPYDLWVSDNLSDTVPCARCVAAVRKAAS